MQIFSDNACRRKILDLDVTCNLKSCKWVGKLKALDVSVTLYSCDVHHPVHRTYFCHYKASSAYSMYVYDTAMSHQHRGEFNTSTVPCIHVHVCMRVCYE